MAKPPSNIAALQRRHVEALQKKSDALEAALRELMEYVGGWDQPKTHPCGKAASVLEKYSK